MSDDLDPFESSNLLLGSVEEAIGDIEGLVADYLKDCLGPIREDYDRSTQERVIYCTLNKPFPDAIRVKTYRAVSDSKHALDQAVGDAAILLGRSDARGMAALLPLAARRTLGVAGGFADICRRLPLARIPR